MGAAIAACPHDERFVTIEGGGFVIARHVAPLGAPMPDFVAVAESFIAVPHLGRQDRTRPRLFRSGAGRARCRRPTGAARDSDMQESELGVAVKDHVALRRGDLVFWKGHVGVMRDAETLLHANGHHMQVASEKLAEATTRIAEREGGPITSIKRL